jgi:hypothetical protein
MLKEDVVSNARTIIQSAQLLESHITPDLRNFTRSIVYCSKASLVGDTTREDCRRVIITTEYLLICGKGTFEVEILINLSCAFRVTETIEAVVKFNSTFIIVAVDFVDAGDKTLQSRISLRFGDKNEFAKNIEFATLTNLERAGYHITFCWDDRNVATSLSDVQTLADIFRRYETAFKDPAFFRFDSVKTSISKQTSILKRLGKSCKGNMSCKTVLWREIGLFEQIVAIVELEFQFVQLHRNKLANKSTSSSADLIFESDLSGIVVHLKFLYAALKLILNMSIGSIVIPERFSCLHKDR